MAFETVDFSSVRQLIAKKDVFGGRKLPLDSGEWRVHRADLERKETWWLPHERCIVEGNLQLAANLLVTAEASDHPSLIVLGDVACQNLLVDAGGTLLVTGRLVVRDLLYC